jgi:hypothetical protein
MGRGPANSALNSESEEDFEGDKSMEAAGSQGRVMAAPPAWAASLRRGREEDDDYGQFAKVAKGAGKGGAAKDPEIMKQLVKLLSTLVLVNAMQMREVCGTIYNTYELDIKLKLVGEMQTASTNYGELVKDNPKHELGPPFLHTWTAMIMQLCKEKLPDKAGKVLLAYWNDKVSKVARPLLEEEVRYCRVRVNKGDGKKEASRCRVQFALSHDCFHTETPGDPSLHMALQQALTSLGAIRKIGPAPKGPLEREVSRLLEKIG